MPREYLPNMCTQQTVLFSTDRCLLEKGLSYMNYSVSRKTD